MLERAAKILRIFELRFHFAVASSSGRDEMRHFRNALRLKTRNIFLQYPVGIRDPLVLSQMFEP
jgi:hypothetical protein